MFRPDTKLARAGDAGVSSCPSAKVTVLYSTVLLRTESRAAAPPNASTARAINCAGVRLAGWAEAVVATTVRAAT